MQDNYSRVSEREKQKEDKKMRKVNRMSLEAWMAIAIETQIWPHIFERVSTLDILLHLCTS